MVRLFLLLVASFLYLTSQAQLPITEVYLTTLNKPQGQWTIGDLRYLSDFNPSGYNNQANFFDNGWIYLTSNYKDSLYTDIIALHPDKKQLFKVTNTLRISEFSPSPIPKSDEFCTVRIEKNGKDQSLWKYPLSRENYGQRLFPNINNIGYFCWLNRTNIGMFLVGEPHQLAIGNASTGKIQVLGTNPGRCLKTDHNGILYYVDKVSNDLWILKAYDLNQASTSSIIKMPSGKEDFDILPDGTFISANNSLILSFHPEKDIGWQVIADLFNDGITNIQRPIYKDKQLLFIHGK
ncbi:MAG: hypothetical protein LC107_01545 [Chitinophagales bacterium]|nr:hypothetical protein [Chitinophagales bacterium]